MPHEGRQPRAAWNNGVRHRSVARPRRRQLARPLRFERLEDRRLLAFDPSGAEQEMLEHVNRMRIDPQGELDVLFSSLNPLTARDPSAQDAIDYFHDPSSASIQADWPLLQPAQPLAWHESLYNAAVGHSQLMMQHDQQAHQLPGEKDLGDRIQDAGYSSPERWGENIFAYSENPFHGHSAFAIDWAVPSRGHRTNLMNASYREAGIGIVPDGNPGTQAGPLVVTEDFGNRFDFGSPYLLGVVFRDDNGNSRYDAGEGLGGVSVQVAGPAGTFTTTSMSAGGYQVQVPAGTYTVRVSGGGLGTTRTHGNVAVATSNVKVDFDDAKPNTAPVLDSRWNLTLPAVEQNDYTNPGTLVSALLDSGGGDPINDADPGAVEGIAITAAAVGNGDWQFSMDNGTTWSDLGSPSNSVARLLAADADTRIRFVPQTDYSGTLDPAITFRAWDRTSGVNGGIANPGTNGGATAFSSGTETAAITVHAMVSPLSVTISRAATQPERTLTGPIHFTVAFNEPVQDFAPNDVALSGTVVGTLAITVTPVGTDGGSYDVAVTGMTGSGTVTARVLSGMAHDAAGNPNSASANTDNTVIFLTNAWQNYPPFDSTGDGVVAAVDVLTIIDYINAHLGDTSLPAAPAVPPPYLDVNGDQAVTAQDVLAVIDYINNRPAASGEGEAVGERVAPRTVACSESVAAPVRWDARATAESPDRAGVTTAPISPPPPVRDTAWSCLADSVPTLRGATLRRERLTDILRDLDGGLADLDFVLTDIAREVVHGWPRTNNPFAIGQYAGIELPMRL